MSLYHRSVYMPADLKLPQGQFELMYSKHAVQASYRHGKQLPLPDYINTQNATPIEVETDNKKNVTKILYRVPMNSQMDIILVIIPEKVWFVKTVWANRKNDHHKTQDFSRYDRK